MSHRSSLRQIGRRSATRTPRLRIVLICEGEKTERIYFSLFINDLRASNVKLEIPPRDCGSDPLSVVNFAAGLFKADAGIDMCFCVIDRDSHANFSSAISASNAFQVTVSKPRRFDTIVSYPSFEYWLLMHFVQTTRPYVKQGSKSPADMVIADLKVHLPSYAKNAIAPMQSLLDKTNIAITNSQLTFAAARAAHSLNPSTRVHLVVDLLKKLCV